MQTKEPMISSMNSAQELEELELMVEMLQEEPDAQMQEEAQERISSVS